MTTTIKPVMSAPTDKITICVLCGDARIDQMMHAADMFEPFKALVAASASGQALVVKVDFERPRSELAADSLASVYGSGMDLGLDSNPEDNYRKYGRRLDVVYRARLPKLKGYHRLDTSRTIKEIAKEVREVLSDKHGLARY